MNAFWCGLMCGLATMEALYADHLAACLFVFAAVVNGIVWAFNGCSHLPRVSVREEP